MASKKICLLSEHEGKALTSGLPVDCRHHHHIKQDEASALVNGNEKRAGRSLFGSWKPEAKMAMLPDGTFSRRHIVQTIEYAWRVVAEPVRVPLIGLVARGYSSFQMVPSKRT